jgi:hypothetical protein
MYSFTLNTNSVLPEVGDVLIGQDVDGNAYLRTVDSVSQSGSTLAVGTTNASLSDVIESASISSEVVLRATDQESARSLRSLPRGMRFVKNNNNSQSLNWADKLLQITETGQALKSNEMLGQARAFNPSNTEVSVSADDSLTLAGTISFEPTVKTDVTLDTFMVSTATAVVSGTLGMDLTLDYNYQGQATVSDSKEIFKRSYLSRYWVGSVPVWQETTLTLNAEFSGEAASEIKAQTKASLSSNVTIIAHYDGSQWSTSRTDSFSKDLTVSADAHGTATAEVRIVPEVEVRFYSVASTAVSVEPYANAIVEAEAVADANLVENNYMAAYQFTRFDAFMGVDINMVADLSIFGYNVARYPETGSANLYSNETQLFGLPTIDEATVQGLPNIYGDDLTLSATVTPFDNGFGLINAFDDNSLQWVMYPSAATKDGLTNSWKPTEHGSIHKVYFMADSEMLGPLGRRYLEATFTLPEAVSPAELDMRDDDNDGMPNVWEDYYDLNSLFDDANEDPDLDGIVNIDEYIGATEPKSRVIDPREGWYVGSYAVDNWYNNTWPAPYVGETGKVWVYMFRHPDCTDGFCVAAFAEAASEIPNNVNLGWLNDPDDPAATFYNRFRPIWGGNVGGYDYNFQLGWARIQDDGSITHDNDGSFSKYDPNASETVFIHKVTWSANYVGLETPADFPGLASFTRRCEATNSCDIAYNPLLPLYVQ